MKLTDVQQEQFNRYYELLIEWNEKINLTAITDRNEVWVKHFEDSLSIDRIIDMSNVKSVIDVGTGAGFPGIPLKIMYPDIELTLLDSLDKRLRFLQAVIDELGLCNVKTIHGRAEDIAREEEHRAKFDLCVSRAVASLPVLCELCIPFVKAGGSFVAYKSEKAEEEKALAGRAIDILGGVIEDSATFNLSDGEYSRTLIRIKKVKQTDIKYPRRAGVPSKKPLI